MNDMIKFFLALLFIIWLAFTVQVMLLTWTLQDIRDILRTIAGKN